jgi:spore germination protein Q
MYSFPTWSLYRGGSAFPGMTGGATVMTPNVGYPGMGIMPGAGGATGTIPGAGSTMPGSVAGAMTVPGAGTAFPPPASGAFPVTTGGFVAPVVGQEESYVENILRMNLGKVATLYMTYENNCEWNAKIFKGALEAAGRDHIIISDPTTGRRFLLLTVNLDYITFDEPLNYSLPFGRSDAAELTQD